MPKQRSLKASKESAEIVGLISAHRTAVCAYNKVIRLNKPDRVVRAAAERAEALQQRLADMVEAAQRMPVQSPDDLVALAMAAYFCASKSEGHLAGLTQWAGPADRSAHLLIAAVLKLAGITEVAGNRISSEVRGEAQMHLVRSGLHLGHLHLPTDRPEKLASRDQTGAPPDDQLLPYGSFLVHQQARSESSCQIRPPATQRHLRPVAECK